MKIIFKLSNKIAFLFCFFSFVIFMAFRNFTHIIFNSPPNINNEMYKYFIIYVLVTNVMMIVIIKRVYGPLDKIIEVKDIFKYTHIPNSVYIAQIASAFVALFAIFLSDTFFKVFKLFICCFAYETLISIVLFMISRSYIRKVLLSADSNISNISKISKSTSLNKRIPLHIIPLFICLLLVTFSTAYSRMINDKGVVLAEFYHFQLNAYLQNKQIIDKESAEEILKKIQSKNNKFNYFIIEPNGKTTGEIDKTAIYYINNYADDYRFFGKTVEEQGVFIKSNDYVLGIKFYLDSSFIIFYAITFTVCFICLILITFYFTKQISYDVKIVTERINKLAAGNTSYEEKKLPVVSNDEIGELVLAFNKIQELEKNHVFKLKATNDELNALNTEMVAVNNELRDTLKELQETQNQLIESKQLAFLGQSMAGIAHSLKTPLMSCTGAIRIIEEKNNDIVEHLREDLDEIAITNIVNSTEKIGLWNKRIYEYILYMNEVINTVKSYAVSKTGETSFVIEEVINSIKILMENSLKKNYCQLTFNVNINKSKKYNGERNSLIQVLSNLIDNAIQSYEKQDKEKKVDISVYEDEENSKLIISVRDYGLGIKEDVKHKLFQEFITTKGKDGSGLGLLFSKRIIAGKFNGDIKFASKEKGTEFTIIIPIAKI